MTATNWQWTVQYPTNGTFNIFSPGSPNTYVSVTGGGQLNVTYTDPCGETSHIEGVTIYSPCTMGGNIVAYPNPANNQLTIQNNAAPSDSLSVNSLVSNSVPASFTVDLYNKQGHIVKSGQTAVGGKSVVLATSDVTNGTYYLHVKQYGETLKKQIIIQH